MSFEKRERALRKLNKKYMKVKEGPKNIVEELKAIHTSEETYLDKQSRELD